MCGNHLLIIELRLVIHLLDLGNHENSEEQFSYQSAKHFESADLKIQTNYLNFITISLIPTRQKNRTMKKANCEWTDTMKTLICQGIKNNVKDLQSNFNFLFWNNYSHRKSQRLYREVLQDPLHSFPMVTPYVIIAQCQNQESDTETMCVYTLCVCHFITWVDSCNHCPQSRYSTTPSPQRSLSYYLCHTLLLHTLPSCHPLQPLFFIYGIVI